MHGVALVKQSHVRCQFSAPAESSFTSKLNRSKTYVSPTTANQWGASVVESGPQVHLLCPANALTRSAPEPGAKTEKAGQKRIIDVLISLVNASLHMSEVYWQNRVFFFQARLFWTS